MNLQELRDTMVERADALDDAPHARLAAVRRRVRVAHRRRRAAVAVPLVAAVVAAGVAVVPRALQDRDDSPAGAPSRLAGREVPRTQTATGFTYRYTEGHQSRPGQRTLDVDVPLTDTPQLVMWASSDSTAAPVVRLVDRTTGEDPQVSAAGDFDRYQWLPPRDAAGHRVERLRLAQRDAGGGTRLALATYALAGMPADAVTDGTVAYRAQVAGESRVKAVIGRRGSDLGFDVRVPSRAVSLAPTCYGSTAMWTLTVGGSPVMSGQCSREPELDAGSPLQTFDDGPFPDPVRAGDTVRVRMRLTRPDAGAVLGVGLYTQQVPRHRLAGLELPDTVEDDGHEWRATSWSAGAAGRGAVRVRVPQSPQPQLVGYAEGGLAGTNTVTVRVQGDGGPSRVVAQNASRGGSGSSAPVYVVQPGGPVVVTVAASRGLTAATRLGLVTYRLVH